jgi:cell division protein FtsB
VPTNWYGFPLYKLRDIGYNSCLMAATRMITPRVAHARAGDRGLRRLLLCLGFGVCFLVVNGIVGNNGALALMRARAQYATLAHSVGRAKAENARLREQSRRLLADPAAIEEIGRRELDLAKPGEKVFVIRDVPAAKKRKP